jgi:SAM-dependent methyltransferase
MIRVSSSILEKVSRSYGAFFNKLSGISATKLASDVLSEEKVHDQVQLLCHTTGRSIESLKGCRLLEVGTGFGIFVAVTRTQYGAEAYGIEPSSVGFDTSFEVCREILSEYDLDPEIIVDAKGEQLPFENESFDLIFSSTVLEHTENPWKVLDEAIRVLAPGGYLQFVFPNYGGFFDGHYAIPWIPYLNKRIARIYLRLWGKNPDFVDTLQLINLRQVRKWASARHDVDVITYGAEIFRQRMLGLQIKDWAGLGKLRRWMEIAQKLKLLRLATNFLLAFGAIEPIILTLKKRVSEAEEVQVSDDAVLSSHRLVA